MKICAALIFLFVLVGCAQLPNEAVTLSDQIGKDLVILQAAHKNLVNQYFAQMELEVEEFVYGVYRPYIIRDTLEELDLVNQIVLAHEGRQEDGLDPLDLMEIYSEETIANITAFRQSLLTPIRIQRETLLAELDTTYALLIRGNAVVTEHLRSIHKINDAQMQLLEDIGITEETRNRISEGTIGLSEQITELLGKARSADVDIDALPGKITELMDKFQ